LQPTAVRSTDTMRRFISVETVGPQPNPPLQPTSGATRFGEFSVVQTPFAADGSASAIPVFASEHV
jgi:hypothetical protein